MVMDIEYVRELQERILSDGAELGYYVKVRRVWRGGESNNAVMLTVNGCALRWAGDTFSLKFASPRDALSYLWGFILDVKNGCSAAGRHSSDIENIRAVILRRRKDKQARAMDKYSREEKKRKEQQYHDYFAQRQQWSQHARVSNQHIYPYHMAPRRYIQYT
jgi:hypothetical protein